MYKNNFVVTIKNKGNFLREYEDQVLLPFDNEYSLWFKNLNSLRVAISVEIDGSDVLNGNHIIISPYNTLELEGFMNGNSVKNKFKFIRRIKEIEEYRGIKPEDGLIVIKFWFEKQYPKYTMTVTSSPWKYTPWYPYNPHYWDEWNSHGWRKDWQYPEPIITHYSFGTANNLSGTNAINSVSCNYVDNGSSDPGITVKGSESNQNFTDTYFNYDEQAGTIILKLVGKTDNQKEVTTPIFSRVKMVCENCGLKNSSQYRFCPRCGTALF